MTQETEIRGFDDEAPRKAFRLPKWMIITFVILALCLGIALVVPSFLDQDKYKSMIIQKVEDSTGYTIAWSGDVGISIFPVPHIIVHDASLSNGKQKFVTLKQAEISVEIMPLLHKKVQLSHVKLIDPSIELIVDAKGHKTWMTGKSAQPGKPAPVEKTSATRQASVALDSVHIQNGHILYKDLSKNSIQEISKMNADLNLQSLSGPFDIKSDLIYNDKKLNLKANSGEIVAGKPTPLEVGIEFPRTSFIATYKGEITTGDSIIVKGDLKLSAKDLQKTISEISKANVSLPDGLNGAFTLSSNVLYDGDTASLDQMKAQLGDLVYAGGIKVAGLKNSPTPQLSLDLNSTAKDVKSSAALVKALSDLSIKGEGTYVNNVVTINQGIIGFQGQTIAVAGTYASGGKRAKVNATIKADKLDLDALKLQTSPSSKDNAKKDSKSKDDKDSVVADKGMALPFDGNVTGAIVNLIVGGENYSNVNFNVIANGPGLTIHNFSLNAVADTAVSAQGSIADTAKMTGLNINANVKTGNVENLAKAYNIAIPVQQTLGAASVAGNFKGSLDNLSFNATADALGFAVTGIGAVKSPTNNPSVDSLNLRVRNASFQNAVRIFSPNFQAPGSFDGPLDVSTTLAFQNKKYDLSNLKGSIGTTSIAGQVSADMGGNKPSINGNLNFGNMVFDSPAPQAGTTSAPSKPSSTPATQTESRWSKEAIDTSWMQKFNADLLVRAGSITQGLWKLSNANLAFKLNDGNLAISNMAADAFGGNVAINGGMKGGNNALSMNWNAKATNINAQQMVSAIQNKKSDVFAGTIKNFTIDVASSGVSSAALVNALSGKGSASGNNIIVKGVDAAKLADAARGSYKPLERAGSLFASFKDGQTAFSDFNADFSIANGIVTFSQIKFDGTQATLSSTGNVNLPRWTIDLKNNMTVKNSEVPPFDFSIQGSLDNPLQAGGSAIEGFLRQKAQAQIGKLLDGKLGKKLGLPAGILGGTTTTAPATNNPAATTDTPAAPLTKEEKKQQEIEQGVKAIQGLFGK